VDTRDFSRNVDKVARKSVFHSTGVCNRLSYVVTVEGTLFNMRI
jgi:hypothetical protein